MQVFSLGIFQLDTRGYFFSVRRISHWNNLPMRRSRGSLSSHTLRLICKELGCLVPQGLGQLIPEAASPLLFLHSPSLTTASREAAWAGAERSSIVAGWRARAVPDTSWPELQACWVFRTDSKNLSRPRESCEGSQVALLCPKHMGCAVLSLEQLPVHAAPVGDAHRRSRGITPF